MEKPLREGYQRLFVLRKDIKHSKEADFYQGLLDKINTVQYSDNRKFIRKRAKRNRRRGESRLYVERNQKLIEPSVYEFQRLNFSDKERILFYREESYHSFSRSYQNRYVFSEPWRFELKVKPYFITKIRINDLELECREEQLGEYICQNYGRVCKLKGYRKWKDIYTDKYRKITNPIKNIPLHLIWETYKNE